MSYSFCNESTNSNITPVDVAEASGFSHDEFSKLFAIDKMMYARKVYSSQVATIELINELGDYQLITI